MIKNDVDFVYTGFTAQKLHIRGWMGSWLDENLRETLFYAVLILNVSILGFQREIWNNMAMKCYFLVLQRTENCSLLRFDFGVNR